MGGAGPGLPGVQGPGRVSWVGGPLTHGLHPLTGSSATLPSSSSAFSTIPPSSLPLSDLSGPFFLISVASSPSFSVASVCLTSWSCSPENWTTAFSWCLSHAEFPSATHLSVSVSTSPCHCLSLRLPVSPSLCLSISLPSVCLSVCPWICLFPCPCLSGSVGPSLFWLVLFSFVSLYLLSYFCHHFWMVPGLSLHYLLVAFSLLSLTARLPPHPSLLASLPHPLPSGDPGDHSGTCSNILHCSGLDQDLLGHVERFLGTLYTLDIPVDTQDPDCSPVQPALGLEKELGPPRSLEG